MIRSGLLGRAILASSSPRLHEEEARALGLELTYELFDFTQRGLTDADLAGVVDSLKRQGFAGFNVTYPFKQAIMPLMDELAPSAQAAGAVNTVAIRDGRLIGHNTDMPGFRDSLLAGLPGAALGHVIQLGAGGAGSAVANALLSLGVARLELVDPDAARAGALATDLAARYPSARVLVTPLADLDTAPADGIVNATPIGMAAKPGTPIPADAIAAHHWLADIIYFPLETELLRVARSKGCRAINGIGMVVGQAALALGIITGHTPDAERMKRSLA
ncbi:MULTISPECIES: shikimate dehydrogenase [unclassified Novosphingobium]|uniref:shikimate dehydrogenase n=1 Tax=unclassified Novosphingobium TaxID=2644732 RepID=UPI000D2FE71A|nr:MULTISPECIES: shikimate dehydrogenase [unclassified Novosphingobium]PTR13263.1 shikimate dehydrogenase [Novosphingobium sp. GV055]PUB07482.1 shikimate dehydrogenase [Novosphingobium sp. GV061]PUB23295.1 shikimate dehydrogenase [Novosphingobium sp. GV079]PUB45059.1 shikimate dehydrogenase [Novosphingobium sp. GV027]